MSLPLIFACIWVLASTVTALLPMRHQYVPGLTLLTIAPALLVWIGLAHGFALAAIAALAVLSLYRHPLRYFWRRAFGPGTAP